jgi:hypothetical protein
MVRRPPTGFGTASGVRRTPLLTGRLSRDDNRTSAAKYWRPQCPPVGTKWLRGFNKSTGFGVQPDPLLDISETLTVKPMSPLRARVENGRLVLEEPTTLPEGTVVNLVADDEGDDLTDEERRALHEALSESWKSAEPGRLRPASAILDELRRSR